MKVAVLTNNINGGQSLHTVSHSSQEDINFCGQSNLELSKGSLALQIPGVNKLQKRSVLAPVTAGRSVS